MKAYLMFADRDVPQAAALENEHDLIRDLNLGPVLHAMAAGDPFLQDIARKTLLSPLKEQADILYRQQILVDCMEHPAIIRELYDLAVEAIEGEKKVYHSIFLRYPDAILRTAIESLELLVRMLRRLRNLTADHGQRFSSPGLTRLFGMITEELDDDYFRTIAGHLETLRFRSAPLISAGLGAANEGTEYTLRRPNPDPRNWFQRFFLPDRSTYTFQISDRDESGYRALSELKDRGLTLVANALARADEHIVSFFAMLRSELAFYVGCLNLRERLTRSAPICFPKPEAPDSPTWLCARGLCDAALALSSTGPVSGSDVNGESKNLILVTGANEGGKSTFLRSIGNAQLMMECGMFVCAEYFSTGICTGLYTHYRREEDLSLTSGKLDEELDRMNRIAETIKPGSLMLFNESFSATNEREGSALAWDVIAALVESGLRVVFVTHFFELAHALYTRNPPGALFLQAERRDNGERTFRMVEGEPTATSFGEDLYARIFAPAAEP